MVSNNLQAQKITSQDRRILRIKEDSIRTLASQIILDSMTASRMRSDSLMTRTLVRALLVKNSFYYSFDSLPGLSKVYAPDSSFRIFTWNISFDDYYSRQRGAIQMRTPDGSLKLFPLRDYSEFTGNADDSVRTRANWIGAVYYDVVKTTAAGQNYYTLLGYDHNSVMSNKKWLEVLSFDRNGEPVFGGPFFSFQNDSIRRPVAYRFSLEYKKEARAILMYDPESKLIIVDHLISETDEPKNKWTYVPDGDYEAFKWQNGKWLHIDKLYNYKLQDGQAPVGEPMLDQQGNVDEKKLEDKSQKNKDKKKDNNQPGF